MSDLDSRCLDTFPEWLRNLSDDAIAFASAVSDTGLADDVRRPLGGALNYLFKSLDLIPDGIEDLGFLDDAFVFRVAAAAAAAGGAPKSDAVARLAKEAALVRDFLGADYAPLEKYVEALGTGSARGRTVDAILTDASVRGALVSDVKGWAASYVAPSFARDAKNLVKLRSFLATKLSAYAAVL
jgi:uncharacterized membrane protein YkvA (DUF1232 family)